MFSQNNPIKMVLHKNIFFILSLVALLGNICFVLPNKIDILSLVALLGNVCSSQAIRKHGTTATDGWDWDYLIFSQRWPITSCVEWEEVKQTNTCNLPTDKSLWTIHGIWPTKTGTEGPQFCPSAIHFDPTQLDPIIKDLQINWINVEANTKANSFWKHEWTKHGTCASTLPQLDSILNFFQQGLVWNKQFKLSDILDQSKIVPTSNGYTVQQFYDAVKAYTKKDPMIQCVVDQKTKESMISEIRICLNKSFEVIDCDQTNPVNTSNKLAVLSNCSLKKPVMYLSEVPVNEMSYEMDYVDDAFKQHFEEQMYYMSVYRFLKFLIWFTT